MARLRPTFSLQLLLKCHDPIPERQHSSMWIVTQRLVAEYSALCMSTIVLLPSSTSAASTMQAVKKNGTNYMIPIPTPLAFSFSFDNLHRHHLWDAFIVTCAPSLLQSSICQFKWLGYLREMGLPKCKETVEYEQSIKHPTLSRIMSPANAILSR